MISQIIQLTNETLSGVGEALESQDIKAICKLDRELRRQTALFQDGIENEQDCLASMQEPDENGLATLSIASDVLDSLCQFVEMVHFRMAKTISPLGFDNFCEFLSIISGINEALTRGSLQKIWLECDYLDHTCRQEFFCSSADTFYLELLQQLSGLLKGIKQCVKQKNLSTYSL